MMLKSQNFGRGRNILMMENIDLDLISKQEELKRQYQRELLDQIELNKNIKLAEQRRKKLEEQEEERRILAELERERHKENLGRSGNHRSDVHAPPPEKSYDFPTRKTGAAPNHSAEIFPPVDCAPKINTKVSLKYLRSSKDFDANYETRHTSFGERRSEQLPEPTMQFAPPPVAFPERQTGSEDRGEFFRRRNYFSRASNILSSYRNMTFENNLNDIRKLAD